jgi:anhydro-N-acetylmuramic acid kinase
MIYKAIGIMSGSSLDGLDLAYVHFQETGGRWQFQIVASACYIYQDEWIRALKYATDLKAWDYQMLHTSYGHYIGMEVNRFIEEHDLQHKVDLIASHGHTTFHNPEGRMTAQLGDGAAIAAETQLPVVSDLRAMDVAFGGQGAPIVPIGEKLLFQDYDYLLNLGGIANLSLKDNDVYAAYDICAANRVMNMIANDIGKEYDEGGALASSGKLSTELFLELQSLPYYSMPFPKSLANDFGTETIYPLINRFTLSPADALHTYVEHIVMQVKQAILAHASVIGDGKTKKQLFITGGGALNTYLIKRFHEELESLNLDLIIPPKAIINFKEALIMALIGVLRWREEYNVLSSVTGATRNSIGGALWLGNEA